MRVLCVCTGNRFRSPLLAHCFRQLRPHWDVRSAGTRCGTPDADAPKSWRACVDGWAEPHAARKLTPGDVAWADVVVVVQPSHERAVRELRQGASVVLVKLEDPAFRRVREWPELARHFVTAATGALEEIERVAQ